MAYYIKDTYPSMTNTSSNIFFRAWLANFKVIEEYKGWRLNGDVYIYHNAYLPNYSYYLQIQSYLFDANNINLIWNEESYKKYINNDPKGSPAFSIDKYKFNVSINLANSEIYNSEVIDQNIPLSFSFSFNQNVFVDFNIECSETNRNKFVNQINEQLITYDYNFSNTFELNDDVNYFLLNNYDNSAISFYVPNFFYLNEPIKNLLIIRKNSILPLNIRNIVMKMRYKIDGNDEWYDFQDTIENTSFISDQYTLDINGSYTFNEKNNAIEKSNKKQKGIFIPKKTIGYMELAFKINYQNIERVVKFQRQFSFSNDFYDECINTIKFKNYSYDLSIYEELYYGE